MPPLSKKCGPEVPGSVIHGDHAGGGGATDHLGKPAEGALLNSSANVSGSWLLCSTSFTMSKTSPAEFHVGGRGACGCAADQRGISGSLWRETEMERQESRSVAAVVLTHHLHRQSAY